MKRGLAAEIVLRCGSMIETVLVVRAQVHAAFRTCTHSRHFEDQLMSMIVRVALTSSLALFAAAVAPAQDHPRAHAPAAAPKADKQDASKPKTVFVIVKVGEHRQVLAKDAVEALTRQKSEQFERAHTAWEADKKAADAAGRKFDRPAPQTEVIQTLDGEYESQAVADAALAKMIAEEKKAEEARRKAAEAAGKKKEASGGHASARHAHV